ncbi:PAS domain S-box-containing protein [Stigmatella aurantiaca]|uniref:histidine kinase n=1 Tax=Stigmatella aurantiaca TaxID=41 RepID=A0A1H7W4T4_STIAU|nr:PAS domain S-box protein [Stigmatella aurantiaca]SEM16500.1 PAS domain S-box-containing protein [Stigmatella aurantiaca]
MSLSQPDEVWLLRAEIDRLRGLLLREGIDPSGTEDASYRRIVESAIDFAVVALDRQGRITRWSEGARRVLGWTPEELLGEYTSVFFTEEDRALGVPELEMRTALEQGRALDERWHQRRDGSRFWASGEMMPLKDEQGTPIGFVKILRDRTEQKQIEEERERFILLAEQSPDFVGLADAQGQGVFINRAGRRMVGVGDEETRGVSIADIFPPEERPFVRDVILPAQRAQGHWRGRMHFLHRGTGARIPMDYNAFVLRDGTGALTGYATISRDLTAIEQAESALRRSDERLQFALKSSGSIGVWDWDMQANKLYMDARCAWLYSVPPEAAAEGAPFEAYLPGIHPEDVPRVSQWIQHCIETGEEYENEYRVLPNGGEVRWIQVRGRASRGPDGKPARFPGIILDITQRKQAELRQRALLDLSDRLRDLNGPGEIAALSAELLGETLGLSRAGFARVELDTRTLAIERDWSNGKVAGIAGSYPLAVFSAAMNRLRQGLPLVEPDAMKAEWMAPEELANFRALDIRGFTSLPLMRQDRLVGFVYAHSASPRAWTEADVAFIREVSSRTWEAIERAQAEQRLRESEARLRVILDTAPVGIVIAEAPSGRIVGGNRRSEEILRHPLPETPDIASYRNWESYHPDGRRVEGHEYPLSRIIQGGEGPCSLEVLYVRGDSTQAWVRLMGAPICDDQGTVTGAVVAILDIDHERRAGLALREREQDLRLLTDESPEMIGYVDQNMVYRFVNRTYEKWFARPREQILGATVEDLMGKETFAQREPYFRRALAGEAVSFEGVLDTPGLPRRDLELRFFPRRDAQGAIQGAYLFVLDTTERKRTERMLREANERLEQRVEERTRERDRIWNHSDELMGVIGLDGYLKSINPAWTRLLGYSEQELLARPFMEFIHPEDHATVAEVMAGLSRGERIHRLEDRLRRADGVYRSFSWTGVPAEGGIFYAIARDVTAEREATALQQRLFSIIDQSPDFIGFSDPQGRVLYVNAAGQRMMGIDGQDRVGAHSVLEYFMPEDRPLIEATALPTVLREGKWVGRARFRHFKTGQEIPVEYNVFATRDERGELIGLGTVSQDISRQLQHEQVLREVEEKLRQSQKMEAVGQLTGGIAHDFNNLLGGIIGAMEMLRRRIEAGRYADTEKYITATVNSANRAAALTARLLAFGRRQSLDVKPADINALVLSMAELLRRTLGESVSLKTLLAPELWPATTDANQFENALLNLAINARDAMPDGGKLTVETHNTRLDEAYARGFDALKPGDYVVMSVSDTGQGMPPEVIARAFEPFFTTKPIGQGTGLGLSMIYGFAKQVGGHVRIYSEVGQGTTVKLYMPRHVGESPEVGKAPRAGEPPRAQEGETVLVVEDEPAVRMLVTDILGDLGYAAIEAKDARSALPFIEGQGRIDLLVTDVGLPGGMNGRQLAEIARQRRHGLQVLFITGYAEGASVRGGFLAPGMEMITKPFALDVLAAKIREMIERKQKVRPVDDA